MNDTIKHLTYFKKIVQLASFPKINDLKQVGRMDAVFSGGINSLYLTSNNQSWESDDSFLIKQFELVMDSYFQSSEVNKKITKMGYKNKCLDELIIIRNELFKNTKKKNDYLLLDNIINPKLLMVPFYYQDVNKTNELVKPIAFLVKVYFDNYKNKVKFTPVGIPSFSIDNILVSEKIVSGNQYVFTSLDDYNEILDSNFFDSEIKNTDDAEKWNRWLDFIMKSINGIDRNINYAKVNQILFLEVPEKFDNDERNYNNIINVIKSDNIKLPLFEKYIKNVDLNVLNKDINVLLNNMMEEQINSFSGQLKVNKIPGVGYFSLNNNQRLFIKGLKDGVSDVLALNGPPGTGKTTVLQSVVASLIVDSIINGNSKMPIIFGLSSTNQAKNNIIDGFKLSNILDVNNSSILSQRWLSLDGLSFIDYGIQLNPKDDKDMSLDYYAENLSKLLFVENEKNFIENYKKLRNEDLFKFNKVDFECFFGKKINVNFYTDLNIESIQKKIKKIIMDINDFLNCVEKNKNNILKNYKEVGELEIDRSAKLKSFISLKNMIESEKKGLVTADDDIRRIQKIICDDEIRYVNYQNEEKFIKNSIDETHSLWHSYLNNLGFLDKLFIKFNVKKHVAVFYSFFCRKLINDSYKLNVEINSMDLINDFFIENYKRDISNNKFFISTVDSQKNDLFLKIKSSKEELLKTIDYKKYFEDNILELNERIVLIARRVKSIHNEIESRQKKFFDFVNILNDENRFKIELYLKEKKFDYAKIFTEISANIDNLFKPILFNLSMRFYEAQFIIDGKNLYDKKETFLKDGIKFKRNRTQNKFELFSNVFPVFVSTMQSLVKNLGVYDTKTNSNKFLFNFIDFAIIDESGQCQTETGAVSFIFSKKAIVVGDVDQIPPIYSISSQVDHIYYSKITGKNIKYDEFDNLPFNSSSGSVMKIAQNNSLYNPYTEYLSRGFYLLEHRRCPKEIIEYCNELVYSNKLEYTIGSDFETFTKGKLHLDNQKPWNFIQVDGNYKDLKDNIHNSEEAYAIAKWLENNYVELTRKNKIDKVLAVLTPYSGQERAIRHALSKINNENIPKDAFKELVVGTAHKLQGAERDIILYSSTWRIGETTSSFIDSSKSVINVAISRAKQSIYVFGDQHSFEKSTGKSTRVMWKYLKKNL